MECQGTVRVILSPNNGHARVHISAGRVNQVRFKNHTFFILILKHFLQEMSKTIQNNQTIVLNLKSNSQHYNGSVQERPRSLRRAPCLYRVFVPYTCRHGQEPIRLHQL